MSKSSHGNKPASGRNYIPITVPFAATPIGEIPGIARWAHTSIWTERMLTTLLTNKVRGGKWHTLIDKVFDISIRSQKIDYWKLSNRRSRIAAC